MYQSSYLTKSKGDLNKELKKLNIKKDAYKKMHLNLNMTRGKPSSNQLDLSNGMIKCLLKKDDYIASNNLDCRNYGNLEGIDECKRLFADILGVNSKEVIIGGNSSLNLMYDVLSHAMIKGVCGHKPFMKQKQIKWICLVPGYDRHFAILEHLGIKMINVALNNDGPDIKTIEKLVKSDESIKGIWCVPQYSNPSGITYSNEIVKRLANLKPKAKDFRIYWDNAYVVHHLYLNKQEHVLNILKEAKKVHNKDIVYIFTSTSKISFAGAGVSCVACSETNKQDLLDNFKIQTIGFDKLNQLHHVKFFKNYNGVLSQMKKHAQILRPKFEMVLKVLDQEIAPLEIASYSRPKGGYFISLNTMNGCAKRVHSLCQEMGVSLTPVGAAYPYHIDPNNSHLRIAPSFPSVKEIELATKVLALAIKIASIEKVLNK